MSAQQRESGSWWMLTSQLTKELSGLQWLHTAYSSRYATAVCLVRQLPRCSACFCSPLWVHEEASVFLCQASLMEVFHWPGTDQPAINQRASHAFAPPLVASQLLSLDRSSAAQVVALRRYSVDNTTTQWGNLISRTQSKCVVLPSSEPSGQLPFHRVLVPNAMFSPFVALVLVRLVWQ